MATHDTRGILLLDRVREAIRARHLSLRTEEAYLAWIRRYVRFHGGRHPEAGYDIRTVPELLGHRSVRTTMIYTHVLNRGGLGAGARPTRCSVVVWAGDCAGFLTPRLGTTFGSHFAQQKRPGSACHNEQ